MRPRRAKSRGRVCLCKKGKHDSWVVAGLQAKLGGPVHHPGVHKEQVPLLDMLRTSVRAVYKVPATARTTEGWQHCVPHVVVVSMLGICVAG